MILILGGTTEGRTAVQTLEKAGKEYTSSRTGKIQTPKMKIVATPKKAVFGRRIIIPSQSHMPDNE